MKKGGILVKAKAPQSEISQGDLRRVSNWLKGEIPKDLILWGGKN